ncbi:MAG: 30S ribosomal protein S17e [Candidatus Aenigmarchaeota archaeon]|nr:30S ribosomal protein S17e [Candidatus Aenigmarchaeota archaeon]
MGRIKTQLIKRLTFQLMKKHKDDFKQSFEENKKIVEQFLDSDNKKIRNTIAGYVTRLVKTKEVF